MRFRSRRATCTSTAAPPGRSCAWSRSAGGSGRRSGLAPRQRRAELPRRADGLGSPSFGCHDRDRAGRLIVAGGGAGGGRGNLEMISRALRSDALAWESEFGTALDVSGLEAERNVLRYRPHSVHVRRRRTRLPTWSGRRRRVAAGGGSGPGVVVSSAVSLPSPVERAFAAGGVSWVVEDRASWEDRLRALPGGRVRPHRRRRVAAVRRGRRAPRHRDLRGGRHRVGAGGDAAVPARAGDQHHRAPVRHPAPAGLRVRRPGSVPASSRSGEARASGGRK